jgi:energy-coupling factor transporter ATP-binding protein EcfA2
LFRINSAGTAVLMATHDHSFVKTFGQRILHLRDGKVLEDHRTGLVGNMGDRLEALRLQRDRERRVDKEIKRQRGDELSTRKSE